MGGADSVGYASARMVLTDAPNLPLVIGLPMLLMIVAAALAVGTWVVVSRLTTLRRRQ